MKETLICKLEKHTIYYINNQTVGFYILTPYKEYNETNIVVRLKSNYATYDLNKNDLSKVESELINYYQNIDNYNITLILPIFFDDTLDRIRAVPDMTLYSQMDKYLGEIFNGAYQFLTKNNIKVKSNIYLINNETFSSFTNWYVEKYKNRIEYKTLIDLVKENGSYQDYNVVENQGNTIVVGKDKEPAIEKTVEMEVETFENLAKKVEKPNAGFVSYILLGIITFAVSFALLFLLVK